MGRFVCLILFQFFLYDLFAQNAWYFGNGAGIRFKGSSAQSVQGSALYTLEGCSAGYGANGEPEIYTDGISVWNSRHQVITDGQGLNGSRSSTQSALVVPNPGMNESYFIFTTDEKAGKNGLCYSVVEKAKGGWLISRKNVRLLAYADEKLTVVRHGNGKDFWLIAHAWNSDQFYCFPIGPQGLEKPVISQAGSVHKESGAGDNREAIGAMASSPDGSKIAVAVTYRSNNNLELFDFNNFTGKVTLSQTLSLKGSPYGLCFSPGQSLLYVSFLKGPLGIMQISLSNMMQVPVTRNDQDNSHGLMQAGPDGKIWVARAGRYLDLIAMPDAPGNGCSYRAAALDLYPGTCNFGLPDFILREPSSPGGISDGGKSCNEVIQKPFTRTGQMTMTDISVCNRYYLLDAGNEGAAYDWSTLQSTKKVQVEKSGVYTVLIRLNGCAVKDSLRLRFRKDLSQFTYLPKFTPGGEFMNSEFYYEIEDVKSFQLVVYGKKGKKKIFSTSNPKVKWKGNLPDGSLAEEGEYRWEVRYQPNCPEDSEEIRKEGIVTLTKKR